LYANHASRRALLVARTGRFFLFLALCAACSWGQQPPAASPPQAAPSGPKVSLDQAIDLAVAHNHALLATRTQIEQSQAQEITAAIRPNPTLSVNSLFIPFTSATADNLNQISEFDAALG
jgi:cobalt-zinc-cadmium efflux system outer membrane protein